MNNHSLQSEVERFWKEHETALSKSYPGINLNRLLRELKDYFLIHENLGDISYYTYPNLLDSYFQHLLKGVPLEYIVGKAFFYKSYFKVNKNVLIPRSETEILVETAANIINKKKFKKIIDIGTGSGAIILSLLQEVNHPMNAIASDLSEDALATAKRNHYLLKSRIHLETTVDFKISDRLHAIDETFDMILSNPPYIRESEDRSEVHDQVDMFEPKMALYLPDDEYQAWFDEFFKQVYDQLSENGEFLMEGSEFTLQELSQRALEIGFKEVKIIKDYTQRDRFIHAIK